MRTGEPAYFHASAGLLQAPVRRPLTTIGLAALGLATLGAFLLRSEPAVRADAAADGRWAVLAMSIAAVSALGFVLHDRGPRLQLAAFALFLAAPPLAMLTPWVAGDAGFGSWPLWIAVAGLAGAQLAAGPMIGVRRAMHLASAAALAATAAAGAAVAFAASAPGLTDPLRADVLAAAAAVALASGAFVATEFADAFANGATPKQAAGAAIRSALPYAFALLVVFGAAAAPRLASEVGFAAPDIRIAGGALALAGAAGVFVTAALFALMRPGEAFAEAENLRVRAMRATIANLRFALSMRVSAAVVGVAAIVAVVGLADAPGDGVAIALAPYAAAIGCAILILQSLRAAAMIAMALALALAISAFVLRFTPQLQGADAGLAIAFSIAPLSAFALAWRGEITPRRSAREVAERAIAAGFGRAVWIGAWTAAPLLAALTSERLSASAGETLAAYGVVASIALALSPFCGVLLSARWTRN